MLQEYTDAVSPDALEPDRSKRRRYTKADRQTIINEFNAEYGSWDAKLFEQVVRENGPDHPAYDWFTWDTDKAALEYRVHQAREFAIGLKVVFKVEEIGRNKTINVVERKAPFVMSPMATRNQGGGYFITQPDTPDHMAEYCRQAAIALRGWLSRYGAAAAHVGITPQLSKLIAALEAESADEAA